MVRMIERLADAERRAHHRRSKAIVEPVFVGSSMRWAFVNSAYAD